MARGDYEITDDDDPERALKIIDEMFDGVINDREKSYTIFNKDGKPVATIMNADEFRYLRNVLEESE